MSIRQQFTEKDWQRLERDWSAWWAGELDRPLVVIEGKKDPQQRELPEAPYVTAQLPADMPADEVIDRYQVHLEASRFYGDAWPKWFLNMGPSAVGGFLGARQRINPDTVWFEPVEEIELKDMDLEYRTDEPLWSRTKELTSTAVKRWGNQVSVAHTDLGHNFDILAHLRPNDKLLYDLYDFPDEVVRLLDRIARLWQQYYDELCKIIMAAGRGTSPWASLWTPKRCYILQCDFAYMISPEMFEMFVLPSLATSCENLDHAFYHLDGKGQIPHLDMLLSLKGFHGIQWVPGEGEPSVDDDQWLPLLKKIKNSGKLCQLYVTAEGALKIVGELGGRGFAFHICGEMSKKEAEDFLKVMQ